MQADWTALDVVRDILGDENIAFEVAACSLDQTLVKAGDFPCFGSGQPQAWQYVLYTEPKVLPPEIELPDLGGSDAISIATAAHEAHHALLWQRHRDDTYRDEGLTNKLAAAWLGRNLTGFKLHAASESILLSHISYGLN